MKLSNFCKKVIGFVWRYFVCGLFVLADLQARLVPKQFVHTEYIAIQIQ